jgi:hypothetical protein
VRFLWFSSDPPWTLSSNSFLIHHSLITLTWHLTLYIMSY